MRGVRSDVASSLPFDNSTNGFVAEDTQAAIEELLLIAAPLIVPIPLIHNGIMSNGDYIGYSNLLPGDNTPVLSPMTGSLVNFTFSNSRSSADFTIEFKRGSTGATPFFSWTVTNTKTASVTLPNPEAFAAGEEIYLKYIDQGTNASDTAIILGFKSV